MRDVLERLLNQFLASVADDAAKLLVNAQKATARVCLGDADRGVLENAAKPPLALAQLRDVGAGAEPFDDIPAGVADRHAARFEPAILAVAAANAVFDVVSVVPCDRCQPETPRRLAVVRVQRLEPSPTEQVRLFKAGVLRPLRTKIIAGAIRRRRPNELWQRLGQAPPTLFAFAQCLFGPFELGDVSGCTDKANGLSRRVANRHPAREVPTVRTVFVPGPNFGFEHPPIADKELLNLT